MCGMRCFPSIFPLLFVTSMLLSNFVSSPRNGPSSSDRVTLADCDDFIQDTAASGSDSAASVLSLATLKGTRPNIVLFNVDDMGFNDWEWRNPLLETPTLKSMAERGVILDRYYTHSLCSPSRAALLSGRYITKTGGNNLDFGFRSRTGINPEYSLLSEELNKHGYTSHMVGKWHLGWCKEEYLPQNRGFSSFLGIHHKSSYHFNYTTNARIRLFSLFEASRRSGQREFVEGKGTYSTDLYRDRAVKIIEEHSKNDSSLFLYVAFQAIHAPLEAPKSFLDTYKGEHERKSRKTVAAMMKVVDNAVKTIVQALEERGLHPPPKWARRAFYRRLLNETVVVLISDNGGCPFKNGGNNFPLRGGKKSSWEGGIRVPAFIYSPLLPNSARGQVNECMFHVTDWYPTLLSLAGADQEKLRRMGIDGVDQWAAVRSRGRTCPRNFVVHDVTMARSSSFRQKQEVASAVVLKGRHKLIWGRTGMSEMNSWYHENGTRERWNFDTLPKYQLFNVFEDPGERDDLLREHRATDCGRAMAREMAEAVEREVGRGGSIVRYKYEDPEKTHLFSHQVVSRDEKHWNFGCCETINS